MYATSDTAQVSALVTNPTVYDLSSVAAITAYVEQSIDALRETGWLDPKYGARVRTGLLASLRVRLLPAPDMLTAAVCAALQPCITQSCGAYRLDAWLTAAAINPQPPLVPIVASLLENPPRTLSPSGQVGLINIAKKMHDERLIFALERYVMSPHNDSIEHDLRLRALGAIAAYGTQHAHAVIQRLAATGNTSVRAQESQLLLRRWNWQDSLFFKF